MTEKQYLDALQKGLKWMSENERRETLSDYEAHFAAGMDRGKSEEEVAANLGDPSEVIRMFHTQSRLTAAQETMAKARSSRSASSVFNAILAGIGLGFFNLIIILPVFLVLVVVVIALYAAAGSIAVSGIAVMIAGIFFPVIELGPPGVTSAIFLLVGIGLACLGILACVGCWYLSKYFAKGMMKYIEFNIDIVRGRSQRRAMRPRPAAEAASDTRPDTSGWEERKSFGEWLRSAADALDIAAEKIALGTRTVGRWAASVWRRCRDWWEQWFSQEKEDI